MKIKDIIYREDAIKALHEEWDGGWMEVTGEWVADNCEAVLNRLPSADRPQGEWIPATWKDEQSPERLKRHKCSECGNRAEIILVKTKLIDNYYCNKAEPITEYTHKEQLSKFCPNCGASMKGADDESG